MRVSETITDEQALDLGNLLLISSISNMYNFTFEKISRRKYDRHEGTDAEESVNIYYDAVVKEEVMRNHGWKDEKIMINIIIHDRYHDYTYFTGHRRGEDDKTWGTYWLSNHIEAVQYLEKNGLINETKE